MADRIDISAEMITWAITRAGYDLPEFDLKYPKPDVKGWVQEIQKPTLKQLEEFAKRTYVPFGYLFLTKPPVELLPIPFYRTNSQTEEKLSINITDSIRLLKHRQDWLRGYLEEMESPVLDFVGKFNINTPPIDIVQDIRSVLGLELDWAKSKSNWEVALGFITKLVEEKGVIITFNGIVENNSHRKIAVEDCRGFVLVDDLCPFMFINNADAKAAQMFTLFHELAHIWIGESAGFDFRNLEAAAEPIERLCDQVAAELLVPQSLFEQSWDAQVDFRTLARKFKVSPIVIGRRALDLNKINKAAFFAFYNAYMKDWKEKKDEKKAGGDFYKTTRKRISMTFAAYVQHAVKSNALLYRDAYRLTGLKGDTFHKFYTKEF